MVRMRLVVRRIREEKPHKENNSYCDISYYYYYILYCVNLCE